VGARHADGGGPFAALLGCRASSRPAQGGRLALADLPTTAAGLGAGGPTCAGPRPASHRRRSPTDKSRIRDGLVLPVRGGAHARPGGAETSWPPTGTHSSSRPWRGVAYSDHHWGNRRRREPASGALPRTAGQARAERPNGRGTGAAAAPRRSSSGPAGSTSTAMHFPARAVDLDLAGRDSSPPTTP